MSEPPRQHTVRFTTKGQVVIPARLREYFQIESGTEAIVEETADGILLRPITAKSIRQARGIGRGATSKPITPAERAKLKAAERALEDAKYARLTQRRSR
ncbi:AbrB/MazE/SpoVT family DNA-binding domain-containing protein [Actomonas aquatica]|uniref:AbrB/MazE/SpoVT family DNA-binding domain-containing protein n=1 Tax=Actomonas aquatica TaxID=2866162 RepID=A0ABZ1C6B9_9BACT|nr:AbrB/MazE/SpoVT family DNA-binding domain-containing protein [Opitutus sp. WL0086]WRQ87268.1 AbrB/MazE/SpoVT family DNA-binding domain-containing protein [Opitutus sp. WL0086]